MCVRCGAVGAAAGASSSDSSITMTADGRSVTGDGMEMSAGGVVSWSVSTITVSCASWSASASVGGVLVKCARRLSSHRLRRDAACLKESKKSDAVSLMSSITDGFAGGISDPCI